MQRPQLMFESINIKNNNNVKNMCTPPTGNNGEQKYFENPKGQAGRGLWPFPVYPL